MPKRSSPSSRPDMDLTSSPKPKSSGAKKGGVSKKSGSSSKPGKQLPATPAAALYLVLLLLFWALQNLMAERHWLVTFISYVPQHYVAVPLVALIYSAYRQKARPAMAYNFVSLLLFVFLFMGFNVPYSSLMAQNKPVPKNANTVRVMSFNCILSEKNLQAVADEIKKQGADVICLQEAPLSGDARLAKKLLALFPGWYSSRADELITLSPHVISAARVFHTTDKKVTGILKTVIDLDGQEVAVFNAHIIVPTSTVKTKSHTEAAQPVRANQLRLLVQEASKEELPVVIMGDFNTPPRGQAYRAMSSRWTDAFRAAGWGPGYTFFTGAGIMRIDYIWTSDHIQVRNCVIPASTASDHYPLLASLSVTKTP